MKNFILSLFEAGLFLLLIFLIFLFFYRCYIFFVNKSGNEKDKSEQDIYDLTSTSNDADVKNENINVEAAITESVKESSDIDIEMLVNSKVDKEIMFLKSEIENINIQINKLKSDSLNIENIETAKKTDISRRDSKIESNVIKNVQLNFDRKFNFLKTGIEEKLRADFLEKDETRKSDISKLQSEIESLQSRLKLDTQDITENLKKLMIEEIQSTIKSEVEEKLKKNLTIPKLRFPEHKEIEEYRKNNKINEEINQNTKEKGNGYEYHIASLLEKVNYKIIETPGRKSGGGDGGIDIVARDNEFTWIIQCKNFESKKGEVKPKDIRELYGVIAIYKHDKHNEKVGGAFFSNSGFSEQSKIAAEKLNITLRHIELYYDNPQQRRMQD